MKIKIGDKIIVCDEVKEEGGRYYVWQGGMVIMSAANIDPAVVETEGGEIEHVPTPLEQAQADLAQKIADFREMQIEYMEVLADDEAKRARLERIRDLVNSIGETPSLSGLITFLRNLKEILTEG